MRRGQPLQRKTPLTPGNGLQRTPWTGTPGRDGPRPARPRLRDTGFTQRVKLAVRQRAGNGDAYRARCEACGCWLGRYGGEVQHRLARGMGGSSDPVVSSAANAALLCGSAAARSGCHGLAESRDPGMGRAGWWLEHGTGTDPAAVPVLLHMRRRTWLTTDGGYSATAPEPAVTP